MTGQIRHVVIVGGGSAGWLTAGILAADHRSNQPGGLKVTLVESPDVQIIGVGEGTWPTMRETLRRMGLSEMEFIRDCDASFKQGTRFDGWTTGEHGDSYAHPFMLPAGHGKTDLYAAWQALGVGEAFARTVCVQTHLCEAGRAPKQTTTPEYAAVANYGYHLDAGKFAAKLMAHCTRVLGVRHVLDHVTGVEAAPNGDIAALSTARSGRIEGDLFIDCTGFASLLLGRHYGVPFVDCRSVLFNDTALAVQIPHARPDAPLACQTISTARAAGWIWDIALPSRRGVGYVYSSAHSDDSAAEEVLRDYVAQISGAAAGEASIRKLSIRPGHRAEFWHRNCVAVGLSAGFLEPLEASALVLVELAAGQISRDLPAHRSVMDIVARRFNARFLYRWARIIDFLKLHYVLSRRDDSAYWRDNRMAATIPDGLRELLDLWRFQSPSADDLPQAEEVFPAASYQYVLYGMGFVTRARPTDSRAADPALAARCFDEVRAASRKYLAGLPSNRELIDHIRQGGPVGRSAPGPN